MAIFPPTRPPHSHTSSFDSNSDQTIRRKWPETQTAAAESVLDQNTSANFPEVVDLAIRNKDYIRGISTDAGIPTPAFRADNRLQQECVDTFVAFEKRIHDLEKSISAFTRDVRPLGASSGLIFSAIGLRQRMTEIRDVFFANAASIYVAFGEKRASKVPQELRVYAPAHFAREAKSMKEFPDLLKGLASELREFLDSLRDIPEFSDKVLTDHLDAFAAWLDYRANGLQDFGANLKTPALKRYTNSLMLEMGKYLKQTADALERFAKDGVASIKIAQDRSKEQLLNMSTVYTAENNGSTLDEIVRALWVSSLILSIASAINSQLAMHWRTAMYRSPRSALPMWTSICLNQTPLLFLVFAVLTFSIGLVIYTYSSSQGKLVTLSATVLTSFTSLILLTVILWEGGERWQASKSGLASQVMGPGIPVAHQPWDPVERIKTFNKRTARFLLKAVRRTYSAIWWPFGRLSTVFSCLPERRAHQVNLDYYSTDNAGALAIPVTVLPVVQTATLGRVQWNASTTSVQSDKAKGDIQQSWQMLSSPTELKVQPEGTSTARNSMDGYLFSPVAHHGSHSNHHLFDTAWQLVRDPKARDLLNLMPMPTEGGRSLKSLKRVDYYIPQEGSGPVQDLRFAPNGKWIAASLKDGTVGLWLVDRGLTWNSPFAAQHGSIVWDQKILRLLAPLNDGIGIWELGGEPQRRRVKSELEAFTWLPDSDKFVAVKENTLYIMKGGLLIMVCTIEDDALNEEAHEWLLSFLVARPQRIRPKDTQPQRRVIIYDVTHSVVATEIPVSGDAQHITVSQNGRFALVSYGSSSPPELWHIRVDNTGRIRFELCHIYVPPPSEGANGGVRQFVGRASFGGKYDEYVVAATKDGHVYVWEGATSQLLHEISDVHRKVFHGEVTGIAWCPTSDENELPLFACGTSDGGLVLWGAESPSADEVKDPDSEAPEANQPAEPEIRQAPAARPLPPITIPTKNM
ncbi:hypothetical protein FS837_008314 [Tulasnella sp. UAMH 9824]|nr:hypothetical protein FS837_008314 [Tulasnella sp. UAMH 9824]